MVTLPKSPVDIIAIDVTTLEIVILGMAPYLDESIHEERFAYTLGS